MVNSSDYIGLSMIFRNSTFKSKHSRAEHGSALVEAAMLIALISVICLVSLSNLGSEIENNLLNTSERFEAASGGGHIPGYG